jgi:hypothetical protein
MTDGEVFQQINSRKRRLEFDNTFSKRLKQATDQSQQTLKISKIIFARSRIFYSLGKKARFGQKWIIGLPRDHSLQKIKCGRLETGDLLKSVFPGCFGLPSLTNNYKTLVSREEAHVPKRLENALKLLQKVVYRHSICNYEALLDHYCPKRVNQI